MIKVVLIDDEKSARENLESLLTQFCPNAKIVGTAGSPVDGIDLIKDKKPQLVFLDIEMPHGSGFDMLKNIPTIDFEIIFVTAYNHYAIKAFKFNAIDYIMKPVNIMELKAAVERAEERIQNKTTQAPDVEHLLNAESLHKEKKKITISTSEGHEFIEIENIIRCEASDYYTYFFLVGGKKMLVSKSLKNYEELLGGYEFYRVHQSHLINKSHIKKYVKDKPGYFQMSDDTPIPVSQRKRYLIDEILGN